jgi:hypothetical protein
LKIYGIFEDSKIVQLLFVLFGLRASGIGQREKLEGRRNRGFWRDLRDFLYGRSACGGQDSDELLLAHSHPPADGERDSRNWGKMGLEKEEKRV